MLVPAQGHMLQPWGRRQGGVCVCRVCTLKDNKVRVTVCVCVGEGYCVCVCRVCTLKDNKVRVTVCVCW